MSETFEAVRVALLIDAENIPASQIDAILKAGRSQGRIVLHRAYADWGCGTSRDWKTACVKWLLDPVQCFQYRSGKNATDVQIAVDAMDLMYEKTVDVVCIASTDCDFTNLALRLRRGGMTVIGIGQDTAVDCWKLACSGWVNLPAVEKPAKKKPAKEVKPVEAPKAQKEAKAAEAPKPAEASGELLEKDVRQTIHQCLQASPEGIEIGRLQSMVTAKHPTFKPELFGWRRFRTVLSHWDVPTTRRGDQWFAGVEEKGQSDLKNALQTAVQSAPNQQLPMNQVCPNLVKADPSFRLAKYGKKKMKDLVSELGFSVVGSGNNQFVTLETLNK